MLVRMKISTMAHNRKAIFIHKTPFSSQYGLIVICASSYYYRLLLRQQLQDQFDFTPA